MTLIITAAVLTVGAPLTAVIVAMRLGASQLARQQQRDQVTGDGGNT